MQRLWRTIGMNAPTPRPRFTMYAQAFLYPTSMPSFMKTQESTSAKAVPSKKFHINILGTRKNSRNKHLYIQWTNLRNDEPKHRCSPCPKKPNSFHHELESMKTNQEEIKQTLQNIPNQTLPKQRPTSRPLPAVTNPNSLILPCNEESSLLLTKDVLPWRSCT